MEYSQINTLSKLGANDYELWELTMPREKIYEIRQSPETVSGDLQQIFEGVSSMDEQPEGTFQFVFPHEDGLRGTVEHVDDQGQLHMKWDNGRSLAMVPNADDFHILQPQEQKKEEDRPQMPTEEPGAAGKLQGA